MCNVITYGCWEHQVWEAAGVKVRWHLGHAGYTCSDVPLRHLHPQTLSVSGTSYPSFPESESPSPTCSFCHCIAQSGLRLKVILLPQHPK